MRRLHHSVKRLEELVAIDRARRVTEEERIQCEIMLTDPEVNHVAIRLANMQFDENTDPAEYQAAAAEYERVFEQGMERYRKKQAEEQARIDKDRARRESLMMPAEEEARRKPP